MGFAELLGHLVADPLADRVVDWSAAKVPVDMAIRPNVEDKPVTRSNHEARDMDHSVATELGRVCEAFAVAVAIFHMWRREGGLCGCDRNRSQGRETEHVGLLVKGRSSSGSSPAADCLRNALRAQMQRANPRMHILHAAQS